LFQYPRANKKEKWAIHIWLFGLGLPFGKPFVSKSKSERNAKASKYEKK
jgi:hypothetical protein